MVHPDAAAEDCTIWFAAAGQTDGKLDWEGLLGRRLAPDRARVCAVPFWLYDLNLGDEVSVEEHGEGSLVATGIVRDAGNHTFRVIFDDAGDDDRRWRELMAELEAFECWFDIRDPGYIALSVSPHHVQAVADHLSERARRGELQFETGRSAA